MQFAIRRWALSALATFMALGTVGAAGAATITFDFNTGPVSCTDDDEGGCVDPAFTDPSGFTLTHTDAAVWEPGGEGGDGYMLLQGSSSTATMHFSSPVTSISFTAYVDGESGATFTPILAAGGDGTPVMVSPTGEGSFAFSVTTGGPYVGVRVTGPSSLVLWDNLTVVTGYPPDATHVRNNPTPVGTNVPVINLTAFQEIATEVVTAGNTDADFCVARDVRETTRYGRPFYVVRPLNLSEVAGTGSCTGNIPPNTVAGNQYGTWADLLHATALQIPPWFRTFYGTFQGTPGYWFVVGVVRSDAEYSGPVVVAPSPEKLITFQPGDLKTDGSGELECNTTRDKRPLSLGGTVAAFGDFMNVEGGRMIMESVQCDGTTSMTRRTTHAYAMRLDGQILAEAFNLELQFVGLNQTLNQAYSCLNSAERTSIAPMRSDLLGAQIAVLFGHWSDAIAKLEGIAAIAKSASFASCGPTTNYKGGFMSRAESSAFTVWDRFQHPVPGTSWAIYPVPAALGIPLVFTGAVSY